MRFRRGSRLREARTLTLTLALALTLTLTLTLRCAFVVVHVVARLDRAVDERVASVVHRFHYREKDVRAEQAAFSAHIEAHMGALRETSSQLVSSASRG